MSNIQTIIERMGYEKSANLVYLPQISQCTQLSWHDRRVVEDLAPYAVYVADGDILVAFFDDLHKREGIQRKIWNAQISVIVSDEADWIKIYNGRNMHIDHQKQMKLSDIVSYQIEQCDEANCFSYWNLTNSMALDVYEKSSAKESLNDFLIENLKYMTSKIKDKYKVSFANRLVLRILFIRYLLDRGVSIGYEGLNGETEKAQEAFLEIIKQKDKLYSLFQYLKLKFNGNLFEMDEQREKSELSNSALFMLHDFLTAKVELKSGQLCLFPFYDFNIIPIELISNIYEILLGKEKQNRDKAFYTPEYLADYIVRQSVGDRLRSSKECKVLDPACGSGIFLVKSLRQILEKNAENDGFIRDKSTLCRLIKDNIYGVDCNEEAVDVTIFSLYITLFDYQNPKKLDDFKLPMLKGENILHGDFFAEEMLKPIEKIQFDYIIGNPPWGSVEQKNYRKYCIEKNVNPQDGEICVAFLLKALEMGNERTECSLVVPSKILYKGKKPSVDFRRRMLTASTIERVLELSAVRKQIFKGAVAPAVVLAFTCHRAEDDHKIEYISLKPNKFLKLFGLIMIEPEDIKHIEQKQLLETDWLWKVLVYGSYWDYDLIKSLKLNIPSIGEVIKKYGLLTGKGIEDHVGDGQNASHLIGRTMLDSDGSIEPYRVLTENSFVFEKERVHRTREKELFDPPYVLFKKGLCCEDYSIRAAYSEESLLFKSTISGIKGEKKDKKILLNLEGLLNSELFTYLNFMLGSSVGIEREQIFLNELLTFPYAYSEKLVALVEEMHREIGENVHTDDIKKRINACVFEMYGVQGNEHIKYALEVQIPILCGNYNEHRCDADVLLSYSKVFVDIWAKRLERSKLFYSIELYPNIKGRFAAFKVQLSFDKKENSIHIVQCVDDDIELLMDFMIYKLNDGFYQIKNIVEFEDESFVIVKSINAKSWHPALAVKDSYSVLNTVLLEEEEGLR